MAKKIRKTENKPSSSSSSIVIQLQLPSSAPASEIVSQPFLQGMVDRMAVSYHKYHSGSGQKSIPALHRENPRDSRTVRMLEERLALYYETGNTEWLMDVANCAWIEWQWPSHPKSHFRPTSSAESPGMPEPEDKPNEEGE